MLELFDRPKVTSYHLSRPSELDEVVLDIMGLMIPFRMSGARWTFADQPV